MHAQLHHRFVAEILAENAAPLPARELPLDWVPAVEWARFQQLRSPAAGRRPTPLQANIWPVWTEDGAPYVAHVEVGSIGEGSGSEVIPLGFFESAVRREVSRLVRDGVLDAEATYRWRILAHEDPQAGGSAEPVASFDVTEIQHAASEPDPCDLMPLLATARPHGPAAIGSERADVPVFFRSEVLREAASQAAAAGELEAGGILLGSLKRDVGAGDLVLQVAAQIPALEAIADHASLRFTPKTWQAVAAAIGRRGAHEQVVGWWHSHPAALWPCSPCPPARRATCRSNRALFSAMDVAFHRAAFQSAHQVALLLSFLGDPAPRCDLFGWNRGRIRPRAYFTIGESHEQSR